MSTTDDTNATRRGPESNDLLGHVRAAFERIALPNFHAPAHALIEDHWQTWQEAWEAGQAAERERWERRIEVLSRHDGGSRRAWHSDGVWLYAGDALAVVRA